MSVHRDPDRIFRAWLEGMPDEAPDRAIAAVLLATKGAPQSRPLPFVGRWRSPMNRLTLVVAVAAIGVALVGGAILLGGSSNGPAPRVSASHAASLAPSPTPGLAGESLRSTWLVDTGPGVGPGSPRTVARLVIPASGDALSILEDGSYSFQSRASSNQAGELVLTATKIAGGCQVGDIGRYGFAFASDGVLPGTDGTQLALTATEDTCAARKTALERPWVHALDAASQGGRGVIAAFSPYLFLTLPSDQFVGSSGGGSAEIDSATRTLYVVKNPVGYSDPCAANGGAKVHIDSTVAAFTAYLDALPGLTPSTSVSVAVDGGTAKYIQIPTVVTADCPGNRVQEWSQSLDAAVGGWHINQGETDVLYLIEVGSDLYLVQWLGDGVTHAEELSVISSLSFRANLLGS